jgi:hypothetical protein
MVGVGMSGRLLGLVAGLVQDTSDGTRANGQAWAALQKSADAFAAPLGVVLFEHENGAFGDFGEAVALGGTAGSILQPGRPFILEAAFPGVKGMLGATDEGGKAGGQAGAAPGVHQQEKRLWSVPI